MPVTKDDNTTPEALIRDLDQLVQTSEQVLEALKTGELQRLSQLMLRRGDQMQALQQARPPEGAVGQDAIQSRLDRLSQLDERIRAGLGEVHEALGAQMKSARTQKALINRYKLKKTDTSTRSDQG